MEEEVVEVAERLIWVLVEAHQFPAMRVIAAVEEELAEL